MTRTRWIWLVLALVRVSFFNGLTSFGGALSDEQIESCYALTANGEPKPSPELPARLRTFMKAEKRGLRSLGDLELVVR